MSGILIMSTQIAVIENGKMVNFSSIPTAKDYIAGKLGITLPEGTKENPTTMKTLKALAVGREAEVKALVTEYNAKRVEHYAQSAVFIGALAADGRFRKTVRSSISKKTGEVIGYSASFRKEKSVAASKDATIAMLQAQVAKLLAIAAPAAA